jgi:hypothetical protein
VTGHRLVSAPRADLDVKAAFEWYEDQLSGRPSGIDEPSSVDGSRSTG